MNQSFDPLVYLSLHIDNSFRKAASDELLYLLSQYFIIRLIELLSDENVKSVDNAEEVFSLAKATIPNFDSKVREILEDFKKEYQQQTGSL